MKTTSKKPKKTGAAKKRATRPASKPRRKGNARFSTANVTALQVSEIDALRREVEQKKGMLLPRWNADPEGVQKSVAQLVLALVEFLRKLLERQAIRRMETESLSEAEIERIGLALMRLEETVHDLAARFGLAPEELNLDLGPLGRLT
jgi:hypothetical protein